MHAVIRTYSGKGAKELFDVLERHKADVESVMRPIKGFVSYTAARTGDGGVTVTVCQDKAGTDESIAKARGWVAQNAASLGAAAPTVSEGSVVIHVK
jgi:restriction endonuclease Mrr